MTNAPRQSDDIAALEAEQRALQDLRLRIATLETARLANGMGGYGNGNGRNRPSFFTNMGGWGGMLFAMFVQTAGVVWWASSVTKDVNDLRVTTGKLAQLHELIQTQVQQNSERLARTEVRQENIIKILDRTVQRIWREPGLPSGRVNPDDDEETPSSPPSLHHERNKP